MPNKTIYISDADLQVFERARELSNNNLSAVIVSALKQYIKDPRSMGYDEITLSVRSQGGISEVKRFYGRKLASNVMTEEGPIPMAKSVQTVYQTAKGKFVLNTINMPDWPSIFGVQDMSEVTREVINSKKSPADIAAMVRDTEYKMEVYDDLDSLKKHISAVLAKKVDTALKGEKVEVLDI